MATATPKHFVLVSGSFHGAWCWFKMEPLLTKNGNTCVAVELPGHGKDTTSLNQISLESYVDSVCNAIAKYDQPVILVGHSRGGIIISQVAERIPNRIEKLVYLCAFLIPNGEPMIATALSDAASVLGPNLIFNEAEGWHVPKEESFKEVFYEDCSEEDNALCSNLLTKEPNLPVATPLQLSNENYGRVKKAYIHTTQDKAISFPHQQMMVQRIPVDSIYTLNGSHSPFLSQPKELADILLNKL